MRTLNFSLQAWAIAIFLVVTGCTRIYLGEVPVLRDDLLVDRAKVPAYHLHLPNLQVTEVSFKYIIDRVTIQAWVQNTGQRGSPEFDVMTNVSLQVAGRMVRLGPVRWPALGPGASAGRHLGEVNNVDPLQFVDVLIIVDPPTVARPGGEVWESNEQDNFYRDGLFTLPAPEGHIEGEGHLPERPLPPPN